MVYCASVTGRWRGSHVNWPCYFKSLLDSSILFRVLTVYYILQFIDKSEGIIFRMWKPIGQQNHNKKRQGQIVGVKNVLMISDYKTVVNWMAIISFCRLNLVFACSHSYPLMFAIMKSSNNQRTSKLWRITRDKLPATGANLPPLRATYPIPAPRSIWIIPKNWPYQSYECHSPELFLFWRLN